MFGLLKFSVCGCGICLVYVCGCVVWVCVGEGGYVCFWVWDCVDGCGDGYCGDECVCVLVCCVCVYGCVILLGVV